MEETCSSRSSHGPNFNVIYCQHAEPNPPRGAHGNPQVGRPPAHVRQNRIRSSQCQNFVQRGMVEPASPVCLALSKNLFSILFPESPRPRRASLTLPDITSTLAHLRTLPYLACSVSKRAPGVCAAESIRHSLVHFSPVNRTQRRSCGAGQQASSAARNDNLRGCLLRFGPS